MDDADLPIDRGWAWVTLSGSFLIQMVSIGCLKSFGLIYKEFLDYFQTSAGSTAWVLSLCIFLLMSCGTLSSSLGARFGFRTVVMSASVLCCLGFVSSAFVPRVEYLYITIGLIVGLGAGLTYTPTIVMVTIFFKKRRSFANGITVAGNGIGYFLYPFLINYLLEEYALFGTLIIVGGVLLNSCVGAALMRPLESFRKKSVRELKQLNTENEDDTVVIEKSYNGDESEAITGKTKSDSEVVESRCRTCVRNCNPKDICDYSFLFNPVFLLYGFSFSFASMSYTNLFIVVPPHAAQCGISKTNIALLVSLAGLSDLCGRILFGWISDLKFVRRHYVYTVGTIAGGMAAIFAPLAKTFPTLALYSCWSGLFGGSYWSLVAPLLADRFGVGEISKVFGLMTSFISLPSLLSPPLLGWAKDGTGTWDLSFRLAGIWMLLAGVLAILLPLGEKCQRKRKRSSDMEEEIKDDVPT